MAVTTVCPRNSNPRLPLELVAYLLSFHITYKYLCHAANSNNEQENLSQDQGVVGAAADGNGGRLSGRKS